MQAWIRQIGFISVAALALACGSKGDDDDDPTGGTGGTVSGGRGGSVSGGSGGSVSGGTSGGSVSGGTSGGISGGGPVGGTGGSGGMSPIAKTYNFEADAEGWSVLFSSSGVNPDSTDPLMPNFPVVPKANIMLEWVDSGGDPDGALQLDVPYDSKSQYVSIGTVLPLNPETMTGVDMTGAIITARIKLVSGLGEPVDLMTNPGGAKVYAKSGPAFEYVAGLYNNITMAGGWMTIRLNTMVPDYEDMATAAEFDPTDVREIGIQFDTGGTSMTPMPAQFLIDTVTY